jgi:hypothetical protein
MSRVRAICRLRKNGQKVPVPKRSAIFRKELQIAPLWQPVPALRYQMAMQDAGREWFGAVCHAPFRSSTRLSLSSAMQRQLSGDPGGFRPDALSPPY